MEYRSTEYAAKVYLPLELVGDAANNNWLDSLCYYIQLKKLNVRPIFYNFSLRKIGALINCSPTTVKTHIDKLIKFGLCHIENGNLILKSTRKFAAAASTTLVGVGVSKNKSDQRTLLRYVLINHNLHNQFRQYSKQHNVFKFLQGQPFSYDETKRLIKQAKGQSITNVESALQSDLTLSNAKIGKITNRSQSTGIKIQKELNSLGLIKSFKRVKEVARNHNRRSFFESCFNASHFISNSGIVRQRLSNGIIIGRISTMQIIGQ